VKSDVAKIARCNRRVPISAQDLAYVSGGNKPARPIISAGITLRPKRGVWSDENIERLRQHIAGGGSAARAAAMFKRTEAAVKAKVLGLGVKISNDQPASATRAGAISRRLPCSSVRATERAPPSCG
jgi:hypothetical protein